TDDRSTRSRNQCRGQGVLVRALGIRESDGERKSALTLADLADLPGTDGFDHVENIARGNTVACNGFGVDLHLEHRLSGNLLAGDLAGAFDPLEHVLDVVRGAAQGLEIIA